MNTVVPSAPLGSGWRSALLALLALWMLTLLLYRETAMSMVVIWNRSETFAHAWTVPPIALWLAWRLRGPVLANSPTPAPWVLIPMALIGFVWLSGEVAAVAPAAQFALVAFLVLSVPALFGLRIASILAFPLGFLFFCVPIGEFMSPTLMHWTAEFAVFALRLSGLPVYQEGLNFVIPSGQWSVVEACSGVRYMLASIMVGTLFAYLNYQSLRRRLVFVGISILVPLVANWLRAYMIVMLGHLSNNSLAVGADHLIYGWVFFGVVIMLLYWIGARWAEPAPEAPTFDVAPARWSALRGGLVAACAAALMAIPLWAWQRIEAGTSTAPVALEMPAELPGGWRLEQDPAPQWRPGFRRPTNSARIAYRAPGGDTVGVYVGYYRGQGDNHKLISSSNRMVSSDDRLWNLLSVAPRVVPLHTDGLQVKEGRLLQVEGMAVKRQSLRVWQTYWIDGSYVASDVRGKLRGAWARLNGRDDDSAVLMLFVEDDGTVATDVRLSRFLSQALPSLTATMEAPRRALRSG